MNRKALLLACIIGMSTMLFSGCGNLDNNGGVTTRNADNGNTVRNLTNKRNNTMDVKRDGLMGRTAGRTDALGYRMMGTGNGMTGNGTTGMDMDSQLSSLGFENSLVIGNTIIVASGDQQGQTNGRIGMKNRINGTGNGGMGGTTGTGGMDGTTGNGGMGGTTGLDRYFGRNTHVLEVTDEQAVKAIQRVKSKLDSDNSLDQATTIASDIQTILLHAKPMNNNTNGDNH